MQDARLYDMHCHLDFLADATGVASEAEQLGLAFFCTTVTPEGYERTRELLGDRENVHVGVGLHPWWVADGRADAEAVEKAVRLARAERLVGEIGLDNSPSHVPEGSFELQVRAFEQLARACAEGAAETGPKVLSIHAVRAAGIALDILEETGCLRENHCIFHWFSGTGEELHRAVKAGCYFSINEMMMSTRRGRDYARQIPEERLLVETDYPPEEGAGCGAGEIAGSLERTFELLKAVRGRDVHGAVRDNSRSLLDMEG